MIFTLCINHCEAYAIFNFIDINNRQDWTHPKLSNVSTAKISLFFSKEMLYDLKEVFVNIRLFNCHGYQAMGNVVPWIVWNDPINPDNTLRLKQNGHHFADNIFKCIFLNENAWIPIKVFTEVYSLGSI